MTAIRPLILAAVIAIISFTASAQEVAYAYGDFGSRPLESGNITEYNGTDIVTSSVASAGANGKPPKQMSTKTVDKMKEEINLKLNVDNPAVEDKGSSLILDYPGDGTINQICSIYEYMVGNWSYKRDQRGIEVLQYSNKSLENGEGRYSGQGDCDDFAILLASLIESIGGTSRIILAYGPNGGHAYTEVYLGTFSGSECDVERMLGWLKKKYNVQEINYHTDLITGDVWLNLDWWKDPNTGAEIAKHPGGPLFRSTNNTPISIKDGYPKVPLTPLNDPPAAQFSASLDVPDERENITFNASKSKDIGGKIVAYKWDFGDGNRTDSLSTPEILHSYAQGGFYTVSLTVEDNEGAAGTSTRNITINSLPQANFTITPEHPVVGSQVRFDASGSWDEEDGKSLAYHWEINNNSAIFNLISPPKQVYDEAGMYWVNLTVSDTNGAAGHKNYLLKINQPPVARIAFDSANLSLGMMVNFTAALSEDPDGKIIGYTWDFGDNSKVDHNETVLHSYRDGGKMLVRLSVVDNDGATVDVLQEFFINKPPVAMFSIDPVDPEKGELVSFDASGSYDFDGNIKEFLWDFGVGRAEPEVYYSEFAEHTYNRPMKYNITLTIVDNKGATASSSQMVEVRENNNRPNVENLRPDAQSPKENGSIITWTATASDKESDPLQFQFALDGQVVQDWSDRSTWVWTADQAGVHTIQAQARDGKHGMQGDSSKSASFEILEIIVLAPPNNAPVITSLSADKAPPQETGSIITWTAQANDPENDPILYRFFLNGLVATDWQLGNQWTWTASDGEAQIDVQIRDGKHADQDGFDDQKSANFLVPPPNDKPVIISFGSDKPSPQQTGSTIIWTVVSFDSDQDPLQFLFALDGQVVQYWTNSPIWSWTANQDQVGAHVVTAKVRDGKHNPEGDSSRSVNGFIIAEHSSMVYVECENCTTNASVGEPIAYPVYYDTEYSTTNATAAYMNVIRDYPAESVNETLVNATIEYPSEYAMINATISASEAYSNETIAYPMQATMENATTNETIAYPAYYTGPPGANAADSIATIVSQGMRGYQVFLDGNYIGTEGDLWDVPDGRFTFSVAGNQMHSIRIYDGQFNYPKSIFFHGGETQIINVEPGTAVYV